MNIIGRGFIATHFQSIAHKHPNTMLFASGVSQSSCTDDAAFKREAELLYSAIHYCRPPNQTLIYISTSSDHMYASPETSGTEAEPVFPVTTYGRHKIAMESIIARSGVPYLILRLAYPIGPQQQPYQLIPALIRQVHAGYVNIRRGTRRDLIDIEDVVQLTSTLLAQGCVNQIINMASGIAVEVEQIVDFLEQRTPHVVLRNYTYGQTGYHVNIDKLVQVAGDAAHFDSTYYQRVINKYY